MRVSVASQIALMSLPDPIVCDGCGKQIDPQSLIEHVGSCQDLKNLRTRVRLNRVPGIWSGSYSSITQYDECPRQYKYQRDSEYWSRSGASDLGNAIHDALAGDEKSRIRLDDTGSMEKILRSFEDVRAVPEDALRERSLYFEFPISTGKAQIRCIIDLLWIDWEAGIAYVADYKTGKWNNEDTRKKWEVQRRLYSLSVIRNCPGIWKVVVWTLHLQSDTLIPGPDGDELYLSDLEEFALILEGKADTIATDKNFDPNPGDQCRLCDFASKCPAAKERIEKITFEIQTVKGKDVIVVPDHVANNEQGREELWKAKRQLDGISKSIEKAVKQAREREGEG